MKTKDVMYECPVFRLIPVIIECGFAASADGNIPSWDYDGEF